MKRIAILYMCTGPYLAFWKDFYDSFERNFLSGTEKHYFVYTDTEELYQKENNRVHQQYLSVEPWPLPTLMKFHYFLKAEKDLLEFDYIYQSNANIICADKVTETDFLSEIAEKEKLFFTIHPGFIHAKRYCCPYDRNRCSLAYVPYNVGGTFVYGAMNGGTARAYIRFMKEIDSRIVEDLKHGIIAKWHDESHINHYAVTHDDYILLHPGYCYPVGFQVSYPKKIVGVPKKDVFDVDQLKGYAMIPQYIGWRRYIKRIGSFIKSGVMPVIYYRRDQILCRKPAE